MNEYTWWLLAVAALAELLVIGWWRRREQRREWECGRCDAQKQLLVAHILRLQERFRVYLQAIERGEVDRALQARYQLQRAEDDTELLLRNMLQVWRHPKRGTHYYMLDEDVRLNIGTGCRPVVDGDPMCLYVDRVTGKLSVRRAAEFHDGRFVRE